MKDLDNGIVYAKLGSLYLLLFRQYSMLSDILLQFYKGLNISADQKEFFMKALHSYYNAATDLLQLEHSVRLLTPLCMLIYFGRPLFH